MKKKAIAEYIKEGWAEAKSQGYDMKAMRKAHSTRKLRSDDRAMLGTYVGALGLFE